MKIGVITPTRCRPHLIRHTVLQMQNQFIKPDVMAIHQNGLLDNYEWAVFDLKTDFEIKWLHTEENICTSKAYQIPLEYLIDQDCTHYFWVDDDDIYFNTHIKESICILNAGFDFTVNKYSHLLKVYSHKFSLSKSVEFIAHGPGGQCSSMSFNRRFAIELLSDFKKYGHLNSIADVVVTKYTMPKFHCHIKDKKESPTTAYVCHNGTYTSSHWLT